jgi:hypothetical protein
MRLTHRELDPQQKATVLGAVSRNWSATIGRGILPRVLENLALPGLGGPAHRSVSWEHPVFVLGVNDLLEGRGPEAAREAGVRMLIEKGGKFEATAEISAELGEDLGLANPEISADKRLMRAIHSLEQRKSDEGLDGAELRALRVPSLYVDALWLHSGLADSFLPLESGGETLLDRDRFFSYLRSLAESSDFGRDDPALEDPSDFADPENERRDDKEII